ncbi:hypothetical protein M6D81_04820 [Paenibacillus sp. J5C_2022]|uniref:hypothetical protein n=1 Tax=Paenibacillus sp. J5C2022 TaxID=2977129 RepID=UPI0021CFD70D|nr:hypothetical protein [Paenibacillus sp. J5C2022]MCU6708029.1 hypothetical protein [Paenibacillus sp. J5C2022]
MLQRFPEQKLHMRIIQSLQQAVVALGEQHVDIIGAVILHGVSRRCEQGAGQFHTRLLFVSKSVLQRFKNSLRIRPLHSPERQGLRLAALRVRHVKNMAQSQAATPILDQRNALRATPDPAIQLFVPDLNRGASRGIGTLRID